jgi:hypothetical protein
MTGESIFENALESLNRLYLSRTGKSYAGTACGNSEQERSRFLKRRIYEEKIAPIFMAALLVQVAKKKGGCFPADVCELDSAEIAEAIVRSAEMCLSTAEGESFRKTISDLEDSSAYYDIDTNQKLPYGDEDLFEIILKKDRRIIWDKNSNLPSKIDDNYAFIIGQTFDHEDNFWLRSEVKNGSENLFAFGVGELFGRRCLHIQRLRKKVVGALYKRRKKIPDATTNYSALSRFQEVQILIETYLWGKDRLLNEIHELRPYCIGSYQVSILIARRCAALLLHDETPGLKPKLNEEWNKIFSNHPHVLGDTNLIQNALYFNAEVLTRDEGAKKMAGYFGLKWVNF